MQWITQQTHDDGISVSIGKENQPEVLWDCAVVSARYFVDGKKCGSIAVLGPRRMRYSRAVPLVKKIASFVGQLLSQEARERRV
jgi:heat-inducible transcriptional repressor